MVRLADDCVAMALLSFRFMNIFHSPPCQDAPEGPENDDEFVEGEHGENAADDERTLAEQERVEGTMDHTAQTVLINKLMANSRTTPVRLSSM